MVTGKPLYPLKNFLAHLALMGVVAVAAVVSVRAQFEALRDQLLEEARTDEHLTTRAGVLALQSQFRLLINGLAEADRPAEVERTTPPGWLTSLSTVDRETRTPQKIYRGSTTQADMALVSSGWLTRVSAPTVSVNDEGSIVVCVPMRTANAVAVGVVSPEQITQDLVTLTQRAASPTSTAQGGVALITENGQVLAGTAAKVGSWLQSDLPRPIERKLDDLLATGNAGSELIDANGTTLMSVQPFVVGPNLRWHVVSIHSDLSGAIGNRLQPQFWQLMSLASVMVFAVAVVLVSTTVSLTRSRRRIERLRTEMLNRDLEKARRIQLNWLPTPTYDSTHVCIAAENKPASHISGDFYNWFELPQDEDDRSRKTVIVIGDVSGHGLPAAFLMATTQLLVRNTMPRVRDPGDCLEEVNQQLCSLVYNGQFVTMMILVIDHDNAGLEIASAGHHAPLLRRDGKVEPLDIDPQLVIGVDESVEYVTQRFRTRPGDTFLLYTDGATETTDASETQFGTDRLARCFEEAKGTPAAIVAHLNARIVDFHGGRDAEDDLTLMAAQVVRTECHDAQQPPALQSPTAAYDDGL